MGGLTSGVDWWEEWQLRVLVLTSLAVQFLLLIFSYIRSFAVAGWVRFLMWLAYLAGDAVAIYALATLFNRHKAAGEDEYGGRGMLEVVWAPILLLHLGGHDGITAYNIEDNELWSRHLVTAVSQVTVAIYVFCRTWPPGGDKRLLQSAILLFVPGVLKCFLKPLALKSASIYSLVSSPAAVKGEMMYPLEVYVERASKVFLQEQTEQVGEVRVARASVDDDGDRRPRRSKEPRRTAGELMEDFRGAWAALIGRVKGELVGKWDFARGLLKAVEPSQGSSFFGRLREMSIRQSRNYQVDEKVKEIIQVRSEASKLFVDLSSSYPRRLSVLQEFSGLTEQKAYGSVRQGLATAFLHLYTKFKTVNLDDFDEISDIGRWLRSFFTSPTQMSRMLLPWAAIGLFHHSHREAYNDIDVKITYVLLCCTAALECYSISYFNVIRRKFYMTWLSDLLTPEGEAGEQWPEMVAQYSFIGYFARNMKHSKIMWIVSLLGCKDFLDQHWCMKSCFSSARISELVLGYLKDGWRKKIKDAASYRSFNDHRSSEAEGPRRLSTNRNRPLLFDESVLLWHIVTDLCFFSGSFAEHTTCCAFAMVPTTLELIRKWADSPIENEQTTSSPCREEPTGACKAVLCRQMSNYMAYLLFVNPEMLLPGSRRNLFTAAHQELEDMFKDEKPPLEETELTRKIISKLEPSSRAGSGPPQQTFIQEAWMIADNLMKNNSGDEKKMWEVIQGVWVEMLCFSASRCRGYLHAKALGNGGEFLSYVWLLLFHMGMETFTDKLNREEEATNNAATAPRSASERVSFSSTTTGAGAPSASSSDDVHTAGAGTGAAPSTSSEIRMAADDDMV